MPPAPPPPLPPGAPHAGILDDAAAAFDPAAAFGGEFRRTGPVAAAGGGFSGAGVWRVPTAAGAFALRLWPAVPPPAARLAGLHALLAHAVRVDPASPLAAPVRTVGGETLFRLAGRRAQLEPWRPGAPPAADAPPPAAAAAGAALGQVHAATAGFIPTPEARPYFAAAAAGVPPSLAARQDRLARWLAGGADRADEALGTAPPSEFRALAGELLDRLRRDGPDLARRLGRAAETPVPLFPVLRDVHREHILMTAGPDRGPRVTGVIDPSAALADSPAADLARLASSLDPGRLPVLIAAYRGARPLAAAEEDLAAVLADATALLSGLAWVARGTWEGGDVAGDPAAVARMRRFARWR